jgi:hypothetical protein
MRRVSLRASSWTWQRIDLECRERSERYLGAADAQSCVDLVGGFIAGPLSDTLGAQRFYRALHLFRAIYTG